MKRMLGPGSHLASSNSWRSGCNHLTRYLTENGRWLAIRSGHLDLWRFLIHDHAKH
jgi:hypothetical protein